MSQSHISVLIQTIANLSAEKLGMCMAHNTCSTGSVNNTSITGCVKATVTCTRCAGVSASCLPCSADARINCFSQCSALRAVLTPSGLAA